MTKPYIAQLGVEVYEGDGFDIVKFPVTAQITITQTCPVDILCVGAGGGGNRFGGGGGGGGGVILQTDVRLAAAVYTSLVADTTPGAQDGADSVFSGPGGEIAKGTGGKKGRTGSGGARGGDSGGGYYLGGLVNLPQNGINANAGGGGGAGGAATSRDGGPGMLIEGMDPVSYPGGYRYGGGGGGAINTPSVTTSGGPDGGGQGAQSTANATNGADNSGGGGGGAWYGSGGSGTTGGSGIIILKIYPPDGIFGTVTGKVTINETPVQRDLIALTYDRVPYEIDGQLVNMRRVVGEAQSDENGDYTLNTINYISEVIVLALDDYGEVWRSVAHAPILPDAVEPGP